MKRIILAAVAVDLDAASDDDLLDGIIARLDEFYPLDGDPVPLALTATVVSPAVAKFLEDGMTIHTEARDDPADRVARDAEEAMGQLDLALHSQEGTS